MLGLVRLSKLLYIPIDLNFRLQIGIYVVSLQVICQEKEGDEMYTDFIAGIIEILYATEEGFGPAEDEVEGEPEIEDDEQEEY